MDLIVGLAIMFALSAVMFAVGWHIARRGHRVLTLMVATATIVHLSLFLWLLWDSLRLVKLLPFSNLIVVGNAQPVLVALLAGLAAGMAAIPAWRRIALVLVILSVSLWKAYGPLTRSPPQMIGDRWSDAVCLQSTDSTCSPAAAATLLKAHGIEASEAEMASLCLTTDRGTTAHGLLRGLILKTRGTPWRVRVFDATPDDLNANLHAPAILTVGLRQGQSHAVDARYASLWGWREGVKHTVVLFGFETNGEAIIGDPAVGRERWSREAIDVLWHGEGIRLVPRD